MMKTAKNRWRRPERRAEGEQGSETSVAAKPADEREAVSEDAWRLLSYRARSRQELRDRLLRKGHAEDLVDAQLSRLTELGYLNDEAFALSLVAARQTGGGARGSMALQYELRQKGIDSEIVTAALASSNDVEAARRASLKRAGTFGGLDHREFSRRMLGFLQRRGFSYDVARTAVADAWLDAHAAPDEDFDDS